jgi:hypothetical protein
MNARDTCLLEKSVQAKNQSVQIEHMKASATQSSIVFNTVLKAHGRGTCCPSSNNLSSSNVTDKVFCRAKSRTSDISSICELFLIDDFRCVGRRI